MSERVQDLFQDYGKLKIIRRIKQPKQRKIVLYGYEFDLSNIYDNAQSVKVNFMIVDQLDIVSLAYLGIGKDYIDEANLLEQINFANSKCMYGKFIIDNDGDVCWECFFEPTKTDREEVLAYIKGFVIGLKSLLEWKKEHSNET